MLGCWSSYHEADEGLDFVALHFWIVREQTYHEALRYVESGGISSILEKKVLEKPIFKLSLFKI